MKFLCLGMRPFGSFANMELDFQGVGNLHIITGHNEAGKSTTLRAIRGFLFGIPSRSQDVHRHEGKHLRVHAAIALRGGDTLSLIRRKGNRNDLLWADESVADPALLSRCLGGMEASYFNSMFGLTHSDLVEGGQGLLEQEGALGEALFGAGTGVGMRSVLATLSGQAKDLFRKTGKNQPLNRAIAAFKDATSEAHRVSLKPKEYKRVADALAEAEVRLAEQGTEREALRAEEQKLLRLQLVIPALGDIRGYRDSLRELPTTPRLHASAAAERTQAESRLRELAIRRGKLRDELARNIATSQGLQVSQNLLDRKQQLENLVEDLGAYKKSMRDLPGLRLRVDSGRADIDQRLRDLGKESDFEHLETLRVTEPTQAKLRDLATAYGGLGTRLEQARRAVQVAELTLEELAAARARLPDPKDVSGLALLVSSVQKMGDVEQKRGELEAEVARGEYQVEMIFAGIGWMQGTAEDCCLLAVPTVDSIEEYRVAFERCANEQRTSLADEHKWQDKYEECAIAIRDLQAGGVVPMLAHLEAARERRDMCWSGVRGSWLAGKDMTTDSAAGLAEALSSHIDAADRMADRLRDDAERAGRLVALESERQRDAERLERQKERTRELVRERDLLDISWRELWEPLGVVAGSPTDMRGWLIKHQSLCTAVASVVDTRRQHRRMETKIETQRALMDAELQALGERGAGGDESLSFVLERSEAMCAAISAEKQTREQWQSQVAEAQKRHAAAAADVPAAEMALDTWRTSWRDSVATLGLPGDASVREMEVVLRGMSAIFEKWSVVGQSQARITHIEGDQRSFCATVSELAAECAPQLAGGPPVEVAAALGDSLAEAIRAEEVCKHLAARRHELEIELADTEGEAQKYQAQLDGLVAQAGVGDAMSLPAIEAESDLHRELNAKLADTEQRLHGLGVPIVNLEREAKDVSIDRLPGRIEAIATRLREMDSEMSGQYDEVARLREEFRSMTASATAGRAAEDAQTALAEIRSLATTYARLILAEHILAGEIERYRQKNQGPVLARASEMFRRMTLDSFIGLGTEFNAKDEPILVCKRRTDDSVDVSGLSDGTRDQLYLALRLASLELHAKNNEPVPLIMDDLLIHFDDPRAGATLRLLAEVAETTQILFFSHHQHLLEIARGELPEGVWQEHQLVDG